eukprot:TRINITY_DN20297_c0_g1_i4.p1 TRINITY_DN20297_c0_g1~~TRINITY_DN20297_c0_g1_i4.p1  ORF type:complete len:224 (+),score=48.65 TRINITY_DN20297_c0_g1_i4:81-674(+)
MKRTLEIILMVGAGAIIWQPKSVVKNARTAGRYVGRAIGYGSESMKQFNQFVSETQLKELHNEMQSTLGELRNLGHELRGGMYFDPSKIQPTPTQHAQQPPLKEFQQPENSGSEEKQLYQNMLNQQQSQQENMQIGQSQNVQTVGDVEQFPISAVKAGMAKENSRTGSQILLDSWMEEEVAWHAKELYDQFQHKIEK